MRVMKTWQSRARAALLPLLVALLLLAPSWSSNTTISSTWKMTAARATWPATYVLSSLVCALSMMEPGIAMLTV